MGDQSKGLIDRLKSNHWIYAAVAIIISFLLMFFNIWLGVLCLLVSVGLLVLSFVENRTADEYVSKYIEGMDLDIETAPKGSIKDFPLSFAIIQFDGRVIWYNKLFKSMLGNEKVFNRNIEEIIPSISTNVLLENRNNLSFDIPEIVINNRYYRVTGNFMKTKKKNDSDDYLIVIYFIDETELKELSALYKAQKTGVGIVYIDNYDELMQLIDDNMKSYVFAEVEQTLTAWIDPMNGIVRKYERDKFLVLFESQYMEEFVTRKFDLLDEIRELNTGCDFHVTLSMGFGIEEENMVENFNNAKSAIEIALGRGGDQAVVNAAGKYNFFGGKTVEMEKRNKVKSRVIAGVLKDLIINCDNMLIMGHRNCDLDSLGASLGINRFAKMAEKPAKIVLNETNKSIQMLCDELMQHEEYRDIFVNKEQALQMVGENTLLVVVDTYSQPITECPELIDACEKVVVIDHHRRGTDYIKDATITYQEPYASSVSEMVTEMLQYADNRLTLERLEAEALYAGIVVDTKNFTMKTGVRTFEAATYLRRKGVDTVAVRRYFQNDVASFLALANIVRYAEIDEHGIAIAECPQYTEDMQLLSASAADQLLSLAGVRAAFVLCNIGDIVNISGRSLGEINVQMILERLGGGGHMTVAGAQLSEVDIIGARNMLHDAIHDSLDYKSDD